MELIQVDDVRQQIVELKRLVRVVDSGTHALLDGGTVRRVDFKFSADLKYIEPDPRVGLSFATNMKKFKGLLRLKGRFVSQVDVFVIDPATVHIPGLRFIPDSPGHCSLVATERIKVDELVKKLEALAIKMEFIGRIAVTP